MLPTEGLKGSSNASLANVVAEDFSINLGGLGSDLYRAPGTLGENWVVTDRGPNNDTVLASGAARTGFPVPDFSPLIRKIKISGTTPQVLQTITLAVLKAANGQTTG